MGLVVEGTGDQYIETGIASHTSGGNEIRALNRAEFWADEDGDFRCEVFGLEDDRWREICKCSTSGTIYCALIAWVGLPNRAKSPLLRMRAKSWLPPVCS